MGPVLQKAFPKHTVSLFKEPLTARNVSSAKDAEILIVFIFSRVTKEVIAAMPTLKCIATRSTGFDHVDSQACAARKIQFSYVPFYGENTVAEHALALILAISRCLVPSFERAKQGHFTQDGLRGFDLKGRTLGLVGGGRIGLNLATYCKALGMEVVVYDIIQNPEAQKRIGFEYLPLDEVLAKSDVISLHAPYNPKTHHLLNSKNLKKIKKGAIIINTARGALVETEALIAGLEDGSIGAAGLDVMEGENLFLTQCAVAADPSTKPSDLKDLAMGYVLLNHPRVFVTPHNAYNSHEALNRILTTTIENIDGFYKGKPQNTVPMN